MTEYLLTPAEIKASHSYWDGLSDNAVKRLQVLLQLQIDHCDIPARQREAVEMVFERIETKFGGTKYQHIQGQEPYYYYEITLTLSQWQSLKAEILDKLNTEVKE